MPPNNIFGYFLICVVVGDASPRVPQNVRLGGTHVIIDGTHVIIGGTRRGASPT